MSDQTAFFNLKATGEPGRLVEVDDTQRIFSNPTETGHRGLHLRPLRLTPASSRLIAKYPPRRTFPRPVLRWVFRNEVVRLVVVHRDGRAGRSSTGPARDVAGTRSRRATVVGCRSPTFRSHSCVARPRHRARAQRGSTARPRRASSLGSRPVLYAVLRGWTTSPPWSRHLRWPGPPCARRPTRIISHASAAALLELPMPPGPPQRATMTVLDDRAHVRGRRVAALPPRSDPARRTSSSTVVTPYLVPAARSSTACATLRPGDALAVADAALRCRAGHGPRPSSRCVDTRRRWPGIAAADRLMPLATDGGSPGSSPSSAWLMADWGLPPGSPGGRHGRPRPLRRPGRRAVARARRGRRGRRSRASTSASDPGPTASQRDEVAARAVIAQAQREMRLRDLGLEVVRWDPVDLACTAGAGQRGSTRAVGRARPGGIRHRPVHAARAAVAP